MDSVKLGPCPKCLDYIKPCCCTTASISYALAYPDIECQFCDEKGPEVVVYHQNTQYCDAESNYVAACPDCKEQNDEYWAEMWDDYYSNCM